MLKNWLCFTNNVFMTYYAFSLWVVVYKQCVLDVIGLTCLEVTYGILCLYQKYLWFVIKCDRTNSLLIAHNIQTHY